MVMRLLSSLWNVSIVRKPNWMCFISESTTFDATWGILSIWFTLHLHSDWCGEWNQTLKISSRSFRCRNNIKSFASFLPTSPASFSYCGREVTFTIFPPVNTKLSHFVSISCQIKHTRARCAHSGSCCVSVVPIKIFQGCCNVEGLFYSQASEGSTNRHILLRHIGKTPASSEIEQLLRTLIQQVWCHFLCGFMLCRWSLVWVQFIAFCSCVTWLG